MYTSGLPSISIDDVVLSLWRLVAFAGVLDLLCGSVGLPYISGMQHLQIVLACCGCSVVLWIIVVKLALKWRVRRLLGSKMALERRFRGPLGVKLAREWQFWRLLAVKLALERRFWERLGAWRDFKGVPECRKERPTTPESTLRERKSMPSGL